MLRILPLPEKLVLRGWNQGGRLLKPTKIEPHHYGGVFLYNKDCGKITTVLFLFSFVVYSYTYYHSDKCANAYADI